MGVLSHRDYDRTLDLAVHVVTRFNPAGPPWQLVCEELIDALDVSVVGMMEVRRPMGCMGGRTWPRRPCPPQVWDAALVRAHPLVQHYTQVHDPLPRTITDVVDVDRWRRSTAYDRARTDLDGAIHQLVIPLDGSPNSFRSVALGRPGQDFTDLRPRVCPTATAPAHRHRPPAPRPAALAR